MDFCACAHSRQRNFFLTYQNDMFLRKLHQDDLIPLSISTDKTITLRLTVLRKYNNLVLLIYLLWVSTCHNIYKIRLKQTVNNSDSAKITLSFA